MKIYMRVTQDKYQIPIDFDTSPTELAKRLGEPRESLFCDVWRQKHGKLKGYPRYICVEVDDGDNVHESDNR